MQEKEPGEALLIVRLRFNDVTADELRALREHFHQPATQERLGGTPDLIGWVGDLDIEMVTTTTHVGEYPEGMLRSEIAIALLKLNYRQPVAAG